MASVNSEIGNLFEYYEKIRLSIVNVNFSEGDEINKSLLLCSLIDTLSHFIYPKMKENNKRYVDFLDKFLSWENKDKISLVQLHYFLLNENDEAYRKIKSYIANKISKMNEKYYDSCLDEYLYQLNYPKDKKDKIERFSYSKLFYKFRSKLVHEFRTPSWSFNYYNKEDIYYFKLGHINGGTTFQTWELVFPIKYISCLVEASIRKVKEYCLNDQTKFYETYVIDKSWLI